MNRLDSLIQQMCPTVMVPSHEPLSALDSDAHRYLSAQDGLYLELWRPWLHLRQCVAPASMKLPYGSIEPCMNFAVHTSELVSALVAFIQYAQANREEEVASWFMFDPQTRRLEHVVPKTISSSAGHIKYERPSVSAERVPMLDCHSHGRIGAFFSREDDLDDLADDAKVSFVVGNLDEPTPSVACRLTAQGYIHDLTDWVFKLIDASGRQPVRVRSHP